MYVCFGWVCTYWWVGLYLCYHDNSKLRASIFTKLGLYVKVVTKSSWLNFGRPAPPGRESPAERFFCSALLQPARSIFVSSERFFVALRAKLRGAVYCNRSCLWRAGVVMGGRAVSEQPGRAVFASLWALFPLHYAWLLFAKLYFPKANNEKATVN